MKTTIPQALKATSVLTAQTVDDLALRSHLGRSRVARILRGATLPTPDEVDRLSEALGLAWRPPLTSLLGLPGGHERLLFEILRGITEVRPKVVTSSVGRLSIDRIALTFDLSSPKRIIQQIRRVGATRTGSRYYRYSWKLPYGIGSGRFAVPGLLLQHGPAHDERVRSSRVEFNPGRLWKADPRSPARTFFGQLAGRLLQTDSRISRLDVAVDLPVSIAEVQALPDAWRKTTTFSGIRGVETINLGTRESRRQIVIYDKHRERQDRGHGPRGEVPIGALTRFEAQCRRLNLPLLALGDVVNPFHDLSLLVLSPLGGSISAGALHWMAARFGVPALWAQMSQGERSRYRSLKTEPDSPIHPSEAFRQHWARESRALLARFRSEAKGGSRS